ncbi:hypothetical protein Athai_50060 [Actinocatenispora thailandica]|uniref:DUF4337 domain-containing protein n=1 Tax=Actinocatenispora thailandica TaxID=227318 RepID=A0A7R7HYU9_9ACTN|nr:hypothetical protein [Actinocatenispora thailandica]BCJ37503.1 hypothetical protein Athai_50060 [Actinocatenispora thailandica]
MAEESRNTRFDLVVALFMALAAVGTAWAGFESAKWSGVQANSYASAGADRAEASRAATLAGQQRGIDVVSFTAWLNALNAEIVADPSVRPKGNYKPNQQAVSGFLFERFRPEFRPAVNAWLATHPLINADAPATPFDMPQYRLAAQRRSERLVDSAGKLAAKARSANQRSDNYVLTAVALATVLFFSGMASKANGRRLQLFFTILAGTVLIGCIVTLALFPIQI